MPNNYELKQTRGALALARHWEPDPSTPTRPPMGGGGRRAGLRGPSTRGRIQRTWSAKSRRRMRFDFGALPWAMLGRRPVMITLTYPREWEVWVPDARTLARHREALRSRWQRRFGPPIGVWVTEFQRRGAPHLHMYLALPDWVSEAEYLGLQKRTIKRRSLERTLRPYEARRRMRAPTGDFAMWLRTAWWEIVGSEDANHHGRGIDIATAFFSDRAEETTNRARVAEYFWRESGKWAQKNPPEGFGGLAYYGRWGGKQGFTPVVTSTTMNEQVGIELRRVLRRMQLGKRREIAARYGRKVTPRESRSRGRDGLTVFGIDGTVWGPPLIRWAEQTVMLKDDLGRPRDDPTGRGFLYIRAFSELEVNPQPDPPDIDDEPPWPDEIDDDGYEAYIASLEREEAMIEEQVRLYQQQEALEQRREELRAANRARGTRTTRNESGARTRPPGR